MLIFNDMAHIKSKMLVFSGNRYHKKCKLYSLLLITKDKRIDSWNNFIYLVKDQFYNIILSIVGNI